MEFTLRYKIFLARGANLKCRPYIYCDSKNILEITCLVFFLCFFSIIFPKFIEKTPALFYRNQGQKESQKIFLRSLVVWKCALFMQFLQNSFLFDFSTSLLCVFSHFDMVQRTSTKKCSHDSVPRMQKKKEPGEIICEQVILIYSKKLISGLEIFFLLQPQEMFKRMVVYNSSFRSNKKQVK